MITVVSPKGGSGKTILSSNLAVGLAMRAPGQAVLIDLDLQFGDAAYALMLAPQHTMADAVSALGDLDATTLKVFLTRHQSGLYILCAPDEPAEGESISVAATTAVIRMLAAEFRYVVIDTPAGLGEHTLAALEQSTDVVLVSDMDVPSVRNLRKALDALDLLGMVTPTRHFVLNRSDSRVGLDKDEVAAAAGMVIELEIPSSRNVPVSLNQGMPLVLGDPKSLVARRISQLVDRLDHCAGRPTPPRATEAAREAQRPAQGCQRRAAADGRRAPPACRGRPFRRRLRRVQDAGARGAVLPTGPPRLRRLDLRGSAAPAHRRRARAPDRRGGHPADPARAGAHRHRDQPGHPRLRAPSRPSCATPPSPRSW